jgi:hypothetical protein
MAQVTNARNTWRLTRTGSLEALAGHDSTCFRLRRAPGER